MKKLLVLMLVISVLFAVSSIVAYAENDTYTIGQYTLNWSNNDPTFDANVKQKMINTFFTVYPELVNRFNKNATKTVNFVVDTNYKEFAETDIGGGTTTFSASWMHDNPNDTDITVHEMEHIVQAYASNAPDWMWEGIADYVRYKYGLNNSVDGWTLSDYSSGQNYTELGATPPFLVWLEIHVCPNIIDEMDSRLRAGTYSSQAWVDLTGKTVGQLWNMYAQNPSFTGDIASNGNIALYKTATASGYVAGGEPSNAVGGTLDNSKWCTTNANDKWLEVDLGTNCNITRWVVKHAGAGGETFNFNTKNFKFQKSADGNTWTDVDTVTGNTSNVTDRNVSPFTARYVRLYVTQGEQYTNDSARIYEFEVYGTDASLPSNVALNKAATASGNVSEETPAKGVDGTIAENSKWCSTNSGDKWLQVDLGNSYAISRWVVKHAGAGGEKASRNTKDFKLQGSNDGNTWIDIDSVTGNTSNVTNRTIIPFAARYVRLYITQGEQNGNYAARIYEFEVYGN